MRNAFALTEAGENGSSLVDSVRRDDGGDRLPDDGLGRIAEHRFRPVIPGGDDAIQVLADNRVVGGICDGRKPIPCVVRLGPGLGQGAHCGSEILSSANHSRDRSQTRSNFEIAPRLRPYVARLQRRKRKRRDKQGRGSRELQGWLRTGFISSMTIQRVRDSLRVLLEFAGFAVTTHESAAGFLLAAAGLSGCVLTDIRMPEIDGLELQQRLNQRKVPLPVIVMTGQGDIPVAVRAMKAGAGGFLGKAVRRRAAVGRCASCVGGKPGTQQSAASAGATARLATLTPREREVLDLLVTGLPNKAIANALGASPRTIEVHRGRVLDKLQARSLPELVRVVLAAAPSKGRGPAS